MSLSELLGEDEPNEHYVAWASRDWDKVKELSKQFKEPEEYSLFAIIDNVTKKTGYTDVNVFENYDQFAINNALSQHIELRGYAYELNLMGTISDRMHYDYMYFTIRKTSLPKVKFAKISDDWETRVLERLVADYYEVSYERGAEYLTILTPEQLAKLKRHFGAIIDDNPNLSIIPTKAERQRILTIIKNW